MVKHMFDHLNVIGKTRFQAVLRLKKSSIIHVFESNHIALGHVVCNVNVDLVVLK